MELPGQAVEVTRSQRMQMPTPTSQTVAAMSVRLVTAACRAECDSTGGGTVASYASRNEAARNFSEGGCPAAIMIR